jgi:hypothetical protein
MLYVPGSINIKKYLSVFIVKKFKLYEVDSVNLMNSNLNIGPWDSDNSNIKFNSQSNQNKL